MEGVGSIPAGCTCEPNVVWLTSYGDRGRRFESCSPETGDSSAGRARKTPNAVTCSLLFDYEEDLGKIDEMD